MTGIPPGHDHDWDSLSDEDLEYEKELHKHEYMPEYYLIKTISNGARNLDALAMSAAVETDYPIDAIHWWEEITGMDASASGCNCCGQPHNFEYIDNQGRKTYYQRVPIISGYNEDFV